MNNYVQEMWATQAVQRKGHGKAARVIGWTLGALAAVSILAYLLEPYWYPYVQPYMNF